LIFSSENNFINHIFFNNFELDVFFGSKKSFERLVVTGIIEFWIDRIFDLIEKSGDERKS
jgi:hypothetical protein